MSVAPWALVGTETYAIAFPSRGEGASNVSLDRSPNDSRKDHAKSDSRTMTPFEAPYCSFLLFASLYLDPAQAAFLRAAESGRYGRLCNARTQLATVGHLVCPSHRRSRFCRRSSGLW